jgi:4-hydroxythreonine-4-phosphate dehydrogenase
MKKPLLAITMGDPAGVGAEIVVKAYNELSSGGATIFVIGSADCLRQAMQQTGCQHRIKVIESPEDIVDSLQTIQVLEPVSFDASSLVVGQVAASCGEAAVRYFETAVTLCLDARIQGVVTCPINKEAVHAAGFHGDIGHQEILSRMTHAELTATMLMTTGLKVAHLSTHKSLAEAVAYVKQPVLVEKLRLTVESLENWGISSPRVAVAALNPHGGEGGMLGREEIEEITPAVATCQSLGLDVRGPFPADSIFYRAINGEFDAVLALYHDQGHIAIKVHNFEESITATMGIPFIRTSVDHGTAFDIAGQNRADAGGLIEATRAAINMLNQSLT